MEAILKLLGFVFLILIIVGVAALFFIKSRISKFKDDLSKLMESSIGPMEIHLLEAGTGDFKDRKKIREVSEELFGLGFNSAGNFAIKEMPGVLIAAFSHIDRRYYGVIYEHPSVGIFYDLVAKYEDETSLTASNSPMGGQMDSMPGHGKIYDKSGTISQLFNGMNAKIEDKPLKKVNPGTFQKDFEDAFAREMAWRASRGGATEDEIRRVADGMDEEFDEETIAMTKNIIYASASDKLTQVCKSAFINRGVITEGRWKAREHLLIVIHENMSHDEVIEILFCLEGLDIDENRTQEIEDLIYAETSKITCFEKAIEKISDKIKFKKLGEIEKPMKAVLYEVEEIL
jgi:hypothetical protein